jgi:transposase
LEDSRFVLKDLDRSKEKTWTYVVEPDDRARLCSNCGHEAEKHKSQLIRLKDLPIGIQAETVWLKVRRYQVWCENCRGYFVEKMPFRAEAGRITRRLELYIEELVSSKMITIKDLSRMFGLDWDTVYRIDMNLLMRRYREMERPNPKNIAVDEKSFKKGHSYVTIVTDVDREEVIYVSEGRSEESLNEFFEWMGKTRCQAIETIAMDLHPEYHRSARKHIPQALHVPDKFHIVQELNKAMADAFKELSFKQTGFVPSLQIPKDLRWLIRRRLENQSEKQMENLERLKEANSELFEAYLLKDSFLTFFLFTPKEIEKARKFLIDWVTEVMRTKIKAFHKFADYVRRHYELLLNVIRTGRTSSICEGINTKISVIKRIAYGYRNIHYFMLKILQRCGVLGNPTTHPKSS